MVCRQTCYPFSSSRKQIFSEMLCFVVGFKLYRKFMICILVRLKAVWYAYCCWLIEILKWPLEDHLRNDFYVFPIYYIFLKFLRVAKIMDHLILVMQEILGGIIMLTWRYSCVNDINYKARVFLPEI